MKVYVDVLNPDKKMIRELKELGLGLELSYFTDPANFSGENYTRGLDILKDASDTLDYPPILHGPYMSMLLGARDPLVRDSVTRRMNKAYSIAEECGCRGMVIHAGYTLPYHDAVTVENWAERCAKHIEDTELLKGKTEIYIENVRESSPDILLALSEKLHSVGICLDTGHVNMFGEDKDLINWVKELGEDLKAVHLHYNDGTRDQHRSHASWPVIFETLFTYMESNKKDLVTVIEVCSMEEFYKSIDDLRKRGWL